MLIEQAHKAGRAFTETLSRAEQKTFGQFMTPPIIAKFMAQRLVSGFDNKHVRILEPSAGAGILAAAAIEELIAKQDKPKSIELYLFEYDQRLLSTLNELREKMAAACEKGDIVFDCKIQIGDFLLSDLALSGKPIEGLLTIANPPFFKLNKSTDMRAQLHAYAVYGQPNIYGLFMAACARLTPSDGRWCFITPRSWMNGSYFRAMRQTVFRHLTVDSLHAFESRREGFEDDAVLQETVIAWANGRCLAEPGISITLTTSQGVTDLSTAEVRALPMERVISSDEHAMVSLPTGSIDPFAGWGATLKTYGLEVSTGPVIAFRATEFIRECAEVSTVPLLWLQHISQQRINWPIRKKREYIRATASNAWMLVKNQPMVIMRRFSPKEDARRVTCSAYVELLPGDVLGIENHLNYIYRPSGRMTSDEARGLSGFLASKLVDTHFRALAGSTQMNATELRKLPLPPLAIIEEIGRTLTAKPTLAEIDQVVSCALGLTQENRSTA
jgi:adenine-specific DNA-methyltransferase